MKIQTINQLVSVWKDIATRHYQINGFGVGDNWEVGVSEAYMHPVLWINPVTASMPSSDNGYKTFEIDFEVRLFDLVNKDESNENDVLSDTIDILKDIVAEFKGHPYYVNSQLNIIGDIDFEAFTEEFDEEVSGWSCDISLMTPVLTTFCGIPATDITGFEFPGVDCPDVNVLCPVFVEDVTGVYPIVVTTTGTTKEVSIVGSGLSDTFVISGSYNGTTENLELLRNDGVTVLTDLSSIGGGGVDTNTFLVSGVFDNSTNELELTMNDSTIVTINLADLKDNTDTVVSSGVVSGNDLTLTNSDSSTVVVDVTSLASGGGSSGFTGTFLDGGSNLITVLNGLITSVSAFVSLLLDNLTGATGSFSLRLLDSSYSGSAIQVRRASDNTTQDIGFVNNELDTASLSTFCSGTDGFVTIWYNQSDTNNNAIQTSASDQPKIYDSSTGVELENSKPAIKFISSNSNWLEVQDTSFGNIQDARSNFSVVKLDNSGTSFPTIFSKSYLESGSVVANTDSPVNNQKFFFGTDSLLSSSDISSTHALVSNFANSGTNGVEIYANSLLKAQKTTTTLLFGTNAKKFSIGRNNRDNNYYWNGTMQEIILFSTDQTSNRVTIETDINTNYTIY